MNIRSASRIAGRLVMFAITIICASSPPESMARVEKLRETVGFPAVIEGRKVGETKVKAGTRVDVLEEKSGRALIKFGSLEPQWVSATAIREATTLGGGPFTWAWSVPARYSKALPFDDTGWAPVRLGEKWGLIDRNGKEVLPCDYDEVTTFPEHGCASFRSGDKWGLIDNRASTIVLQPEWEAVQPLIRGFIPVKRGGKWGYADSQGRLVIAPQWDNAWRFSPVGTAVVTVGTEPETRKRGFIDKSGKLITPAEWDGAINHVAEGVGAVRRGDGWALVDKTGKVLGDPEWQMIWQSLRPELGILPVRKNGKWGILGLDAVVRVPPEYDGFASAQTGILLSKKPSKDRQSAPSGGGQPSITAGSAGDSSRKVRELLSKPAPAASPAAVEDSAIFVGKDGRVVHRIAGFDEFLESSEGLLPARSGDKWGFVDEKGKTVIAPTWDEVGKLEEGLVPVKNKDDKAGWRFLKADGAPAFPPLEGVQLGYPWRAPRFSNGFVRGTKEGGVSVLVTRDGRIDGEAREDMWLPEGLQIAGVYVDHVSRHGRYGYMRNLSGSGGVSVIRDIPVEMTSFEGAFPYAGPPRYGLVSVDGRVLAEPTWDWATLLPGGWVRVWAGDRAGLVDPEGRKILRPEWDDVELADNGLLLATKDGRVSVFDQNGKALLPAGRKDAAYVDHYANGFIASSAGSDGSTLWSLCDPRSGAPVDFGSAARVYWNEDLAESGLLWIEERDSARWSLIRRDGTPLGITQDAQPARWFMHEGFGILTKTDGTKIHLGADGQTLGSTAWEDAGLFNHGLAAVRTAGKWGFLDKKGKLALPAEWTEAGDFQNLGTENEPVLLVRVARSKLWGCIDQTGKTVIEPSWDEIGPFLPVGTGRFVAFVRRGKLWGCVDQTGKTTVEPCSQDVGVVESGLIRLTIQKNGERYGRYVRYDANGKEVDPAAMDAEGKNKSDPLSEGMQIAKSADGKFGLNDASGNVVLEPKWDHVAWVGPRIVAAWTENEGGIFDATGKALFRDDAKRRLARFDRPSRETTPARYQQGVVLIEATPVWGYAKLVSKK